MRYLRVLTMVSAITMVSIVLASVQEATGAVNLRFSPADTVIMSGQTSRLSIFVDDLDANVRTIDLHVTYDTTIVSSLGGGAGKLYTDSGFTLFQGIENNVPGQWHGYVVILGSEDFLEGPGELYYWEYSALADGVTPIIAVEAYVAAGDGTYYPDVELEATTIIVGDPLSAADDLPQQPLSLAVWPNPFNPRSSLLVDLQEPSDAHVAVYDVRGRTIFVMHDGPLLSGETVFTWHGNDTHGQAQPSGQYLFRVKTRTGSRVIRATLVR